MKASLISAALMSPCLALVGIRATIPTFTSLQVDTKKLRKTDNDTQLQQNRYRIGGGWTHCWEDRKMDQLIVMIVYVRNNTNLLLRLKECMSFSQSPHRWLHISQCFLKLYRTMSFKDEVNHAFHYHTYSSDFVDIYNQQSETTNYVCPPKNLWVLAFVIFGVSFYYFRYFYRLQA